MRIKMLAVVASVLLMAQGAFAADPTTFKFFTYDLLPNWSNMQDDIGKVITAKTGVNLNVEQSIGDAEQKISLIAASGELPDLISPKGKSTELIDAGYLLDLTKLIDQYAPNIKKALGDQIKRLRYNSKNPAIYFIPTYSTLNRVVYDEDAYFKLQLGALKEMKYPSVKTLADYEKVIATYVKAHPTTDGQPTIGLSLLADDWRFVITVTNPAFWATGNPDDGEWLINPKTFEAKEHFFNPKEREYFRWLNHMNDIGLLDKESFTQKYDQYKAKIATGRVVGLIDANWEAGDAFNALKSDGKFDKLYGRFPVGLDKNIKTAWLQSVGFDGGWGIAITTACKDPVKAIKFLDFLASDEGQVLINWGVEGKDYTMVKGVRTLTADVVAEKKSDMTSYTKRVGVGNYNNFSLKYGDGAKDKSGNFYTTNNPDSILDGYTDLEKEALKAYKVKFWGDMLPKATEFPVKAWGAAWNIPIADDNPLKKHWDVEQNITRKRITEMVLGKPAEFDKKYDAFLAELTAATGPLAKNMTQLVQDRIALWTK